MADTDCPNQNIIKSKAHILATRPLTEALLQKAATQGIQVDVVPMIGIVPVQSKALTERMTMLAGEKAIVILTSANSIQQLKALLPAPPDWSVACLEGNTLKEAIAFFGRDRIRCAAPDATSLAVSIQADPAITRAVFFCGDRRLDLLPEALKAAGIQLEEVVLYATQLQPAAIEKAYDAVLFCSPSAVDSFFKINTLSRDTILFAIGNTTAKQVR